MAAPCVCSPYGYALCFNEECQLRDTCLHYQAYLLKSADRLGGPAIYPDAWKNGQCQRYNEVRLAKKAWGFTHIMDILAQYGPTDGLAFDHYETVWDFD